jgi:hypothetical protein
VFIKACKVLGGFGDDSCSHTVAELVLH